MADGRWPMADGRWPMADGRWPMAEKVASPGRRAVLHQFADHPSNVIGLVEDLGYGNRVEAPDVTGVVLSTSLSARSLEIG
jgi:hypothetical protein